MDHQRVTAEKGSGGGGKVGGAQPPPALIRRPDVASGTWPAQGYDGPVPNTLTFKRVIVKSGGNRKTLQNEELGWRLTA